jgi:hypothetical protein
LGGYGNVSLSLELRSKALLAHFAFSLVAVLQ